MNNRFTPAFSRLRLVACVFIVFAESVVFAQTGAKVNRIALLGSETGLQLKITSNIPVATDTQVLNGPDRIVIDFPGALPSNELRGFVIKQAGVRAVRVGLFASNPPRTRVVIDLEHPMQYQVLPSGNSVLVKLGSSPSLVAVSSNGTVRVGSARITPPTAAPAPAPLQVSFDRGQLWVSARNVSLAEVLYQIHLRTGADIPIPAGAEQEKVVATAGPGPAKDVVATILNGSRFNFVLVGSAQDQNVLRSVILTPKMDTGYQQVMTATQPAAAPQPQPEPQGELPVEYPPPTPAEIQSQQQGQPQQDGPPPQPQPEAQPVPEAPIPDQGQTMPPPTTPPPPPTQEPNRPWSEPPPTTPQPD